MMDSSLNDKNGAPWEGFLNESSLAADEEPARTFAGKRVLVTGAGGYIGSALARALSRLPIEQLLLLDNSEYGLYLLENDLSAKPASFSYKMIVGSICDQAIVEELFAEQQPHIIFHAAALKHVQLMESNPFAAVETNALGTARVAQLAARCHAEQMVLVSTDKAVHPISIMGASKRLAELFMLSISSATTMKTLRLCNVLGSTGSVAPLFQHQLQQGMPVTVTHPDATRFFLSIERTVECLLHLASVEKSGLFIPQTGAPYRIEDLARFLLGKASAEERRIVHTGLRVGDKLHEQMMSNCEQQSVEVLDERVLACRSVPPEAGQLEQRFDDLRRSVSSRHLLSLLHFLHQLVPDYEASEALANTKNEPLTEVR